MDIIFDKEKKVCGGNEEEKVGGKLKRFFASDEMKLNLWNLIEPNRQNEKRLKLFLLLSLFSVQVRALAWLVAFSRVQVGQVKLEERKEGKGGRIKKRDGQLSLSLSHTLTIRTSFSVWRSAHTFLGYHRRTQRRAYTHTHTHNLLPVRLGQVNKWMIS